MEVWSICATSYLDAWPECGGDLPVGLLRRAEEIADVSDRVSPVCVCVCVCARARARARVCVRMCLCVCVCTRARTRAHIDTRVRDTACCAHGNGNHDTKYSAVAKKSTPIVDL